MFSRVILFSGMQRCFSKILPNPTKLLKALCASKNSTYWHSGIIKPP